MVFDGPFLSLHDSITGSVTRMISFRGMCGSGFFEDVVPHVVVIINGVTLL